jgi:hypothetical protein
MKTSSQRIAVRIVMFVALTAGAACADSIAAPRPVAGRRAAHDTIPPNMGDTILCKGGYTIIFGRIVCSEQ